MGIFVANSSRAWSEALSSVQQCPKSPNTLCLPGRRFGALHVSAIRLKPPCTSQVALHRGPSHIFSPEKTASQDKVVSKDHVFPNVTSEPIILFDVPEWLGRNYQYLTTPVGNLILPIIYSW